jgi:hypothetical protein
MTQAAVVETAQGRVYDGDVAREKREKMLRARVTREELRLMTEAAERRALSVTDWVRQTLLLEARRVLRIPLGGMKKMEKQELRVGMLDELKRKYPEKVAYLEEVGFEWVKQGPDGQPWTGFVVLRSNGQPMAFSYAHVEDTSLDVLKEQVRTGLPVEKG